MKTPFIWLGSGRSKKQNVGHKVRLLDKAAKAGLPVPNGGVLLHEFYIMARQAGTIQEVDGGVVVPDPIWLYEVLRRDVRFPPLPGKVAICPPFARRLQKLLRSVRRTFGAASWQVTWGDDGAICWLLQLQPVSPPA